MSDLIQTRAVLGKETCPGQFPNRPALTCPESPALGPSFPTLRAITTRSSALTMVTSSPSWSRRRGTAGCMERWRRVDSTLHFFYFTSPTSIYWMWSKRLTFTPLFSLNEIYLKSSEHTRYWTELVLHSNMPMQSIEYLYTHYFCTSSQAQYTSCWK